MTYRISARYKASALCEISVDVDGLNYLVIYGSHINGVWCCIPNWEIGCEMGDPTDTFFNTEALTRAGLGANAARAIASAIAVTVKTEVQP